MLKRPRHVLAAVGRLRQVLFILVFAGTVLNVWIALEAVVRVDSSYSFGIGSVGDVLSSPPEPTAVDRLSVQKWDIESPEWSKVNQYDSWRKALVRFHVQQLSLWDRAAKIEFTLLAGALCVWLLLPREVAPRREC